MIERHPWVLLVLAAACAAPPRAPESPVAAPPPAIQFPSVGPPAPRPTASGPRNGATALDEFERRRIRKELTDLAFHAELGDEMIVRKVNYAADDGLRIPAYLFASFDTARARPVVLMVHGGIHGDFDEQYVWQVRSLVAEGYLIVAPEYRGSTGYGREHYDAIDYGGKEVEDVISARDFLAERVPYADTSRMGLIGWSHGGFIALHAVIRRPELFKVAVAHVPVTDLPTRIRTHSEAYHRLFVEQRGFGARLEENPRPYVERSPIAHARTLKTAVLVHAADNDEDVFIIENRNLRDSMVAAGKDREGMYTYREWHNPPGGHIFSRLRTPQGFESWRESVAFLNRYLAPER